MISFLGLRSVTSARYISQRSRGRESNAIFFPSGDHCGLPLTSRGFEICTRLLPSSLLIQTPGTPDRSDARAMRFPSGEYWALNCALVEEMSSTAGASGCTRSLRQMFALLEIELKAKLVSYGRNCWPPCVSRESKPLDRAIRGSNCAEFIGVNYSYGIKEFVVVGRPG